ncbi:MAG: RNA polymerase sigma factor, partial [Micromonosporaceae bacterium]
DLVDAAFAALLTELRSGDGPDLAFRTALHSAVRRAAEQDAGPPRPVAEPDAGQSPGKQDGVATGADLTPEPADAANALNPEASRVLAAFHSLPERWQLLVWHAKVEGDTAPQIARHVGLTTNAVEALTHRAVERVHHEYLHAHLADAPPADDCADIAPLLVDDVRDDLSGRDESVVAHLDGCSGCTELRAALADLETRLPELLAAAVLGATWAAYLRISAPADSRRGVLALVAGWVGAATGQLRAFGGHSDAASPAGTAGTLTSTSTRNKIIAASAAAVLAAGVVLAFSMSDDPANSPPPAASGKQPGDGPGDTAPPAPPTASPDQPDESDGAGQPKQPGKSEAAPREPTDKPPAPEDPGHGEPPGQTPPGPPSNPGDPAPEPPISLTYEDGTLTLRAGDTATVSITVRTQPARASLLAAPQGVIRELRHGQALTLELNLPRGIRLADKYAGDGWWCSQRGHGAQCEHSTMQLGETATADLVLRAHPKLTGDREITTVARQDGLSAADTLKVQIEAQDKSSRNRHDKAGPRDFDYDGRGPSDHWRRHG